MKKLQAIMLSAALVGAHPVHALINDGKFAEPGELFVSIYDAAGKKSFYKDLGLSMGSFVANPASASFDLGADPNFAAFAGKADLVFNVGAVNELLKDQSNITTWGYLATSSEGASIFNASWTAVDNTLQKIQSYIVYLNPEGFNNAAGQSAENLSGVYQPGDQGYHGADSWGSRMGQSVGGNTEGAVGEDVDFYFVGNSTGDTAGKQVVKLGTWSLSSVGQLTFAGSGSPTPTPSPSPSPSTSPTPTPTPVPTALDLSGPASVKVKAKEFFTWNPDFTQVKKKKLVKFKFSKDGGKFKLVGTAKYKKGKFKWKPRKKYMTENGVLEACVKPSKKAAPICSRLSVSVQ